MGLNINEFKDTWYFSTFGFLGFGVERTLAIYKLNTMELTVTQRGFKHLNAIFKHLKKHLDTRKIMVIWYKDEETK